MSQDDAIMTETSPSAPPRKGRPLLAWLVIFAVVACILCRYETVSPQQRQRYDLVTMRLEGRYIVGVAGLEERFLGDQKSGRQQLYKETQSLNRGTYAQRLRFVVLVGELKGAD